MRGIFLCSLLLLSACASTEITQSPQTAYVSLTEVPKEPAVIWTSRTIPQNFDYLGIVKVRTFSYEGALERLIEGAKELRADAITDVHYERMGFFKIMEAFAIRFK